MKWVKGGNLKCSWTKRAWSSLARRLAGTLLSPRLSPELLQSVRFMAGAPPAPSFLFLCKKDCTEGPQASWPPSCIPSFGGVSVHAWGGGRWEGLGKEEKRKRRGCLLPRDTLAEDTLTQRTGHTYEQEGGQSGQNPHVWSFPS